MSYLAFLHFRHVPLYEALKIAKNKNLSSVQFCFSVFNIVYLLYLPVRNALNFLCVFLLITIIHTIKIMFVISLRHLKFSGIVVEFSGCGTPIGCNYSFSLQLGVITVNLK